MLLSKQLAQSFCVSCDFLKHHAVERRQQAQLIPELLNFSSPTVEILRLRFLERFGQQIAAATIGVCDRAAYLFPADILKAPLRQPLLQRLQLSHNLFFPTGSRRGKAIRFQREQVFYALKDSAESSRAKFFSKLDDGLQPDMRVAKVRNHFRNLAHTAVFPFISSLPDFVFDQPQGGPQFLEVLAKLVHGLAPLSGRTLCLFEG